MSAASGQVRIIPVIVVVPPRALLLDIAGPLEVLRRANVEQSATRFTVTYVGPRADVASSIGLGLAGVKPLPGGIARDSFVLVPGSADASLSSDGEDRNAEAAAQEEIVRWLRATISPGMRLASICSGALLAGKAGLLDGVECTTHHGTIDELVRAAPRARVVENRLFVDAGDRLTSAGVTAGIDLLLHIVSRETGPATALAVARHLVVYLRRGGSDPQLSPWLDGRNHIHPAIHRAQDAVVAEPGRVWSVAVLANVAGTSPRNLSRLFNEQAGMSVTDYVTRIRIALAHELVTASRLDMEGVAEQAGFGSARQLRRAWKRYHGVSPVRTRRDRSQAPPLPSNSAADTTT